MFSKQFSFIDFRFFFTTFFYSDAASKPLLENDFKVKEIIDVEKAMLDNSKEEKKRSRVTKVMTYLNKFACAIITFVMLVGASLIAAHFIIHS